MRLCQHAAEFIGVPDPRRLLEGSCPVCPGELERVDEWARCKCCRRSWQMRQHEPGVVEVAVREEWVDLPTGENFERVTKREVETR
jgi:hypothetical protein